MQVVQNMQFKPVDVLPFFSRIKYLQKDFESAKSFHGDNLKTIGNKKYETKNFIYLTEKANVLLSYQINKNNKKGKEKR